MTTGGSPVVVIAREPRSRLPLHLGDWVWVTHWLPVTRASVGCNVRRSETHGQMWSTCGQRREHGPLLTVRARFASDVVCSGTAVHRRTSKRAAGLLAAHRIPIS